MKNECDIEGGRGFCLSLINTSLLEIKASLEPGVSGAQDTNGEVQ